LLIDPLPKIRKGLIVVKFYMLDFFTRATIHEFSPSILTLLYAHPLARSGVVVPWDGTLTGLPKDRPAFVHAAQSIRCTRIELARKCKPLGHVPFYDDALVGLDGELYPRALYEAVQAFLKRTGRISPAT
jgi:hypothetical protein